MTKDHTAEEVVILDFETTGLSTDSARVIEIGAVIVKGDHVKSTFSELCNPGQPIPGFITGLTGITNAMLKGKPLPEELMADFYDYIGDRPILAHNASFDSRFLKAEMKRINKSIGNPILCTMLLSRRLIRDVRDHKLGTLKKYIKFEEPPSHVDHRALDDAKVTTCLWVYLQRLTKTLTGKSPLEFSHFQKISRMSKQKAAEWLQERSKEVPVTHR